MTIKAALAQEIENRFPNQVVRIDLSANPFAIIMGPQEIGEIGIWDDGEEATLTIGEITHSHFNPYDSTLSPTEREAIITEQVLDFLDDLFQDKVLMWVANQGGSGGWARFENEPPPIRANAKNFLWSGQV